MLQLPKSSAQLWRAAHLRGPAGNPALGFVLSIRRAQDGAEAGGGLLASLTLDAAASVTNSVSDFSGAEGQTACCCQESRESSPAVAEPNLLGWLNLLLEMALPRAGDFAARWVRVSGLGERWRCSFQSTDATWMRFYELMPARKFSVLVLLQNRVPGEIFTPGCLNHSSPPSVLESAWVSHGQKPFAFHYRGESQASHPACPKERALPSSLTPSSAHRPAACPR